MIEKVKKAPFFRLADAGREWWHYSCSAIEPQAYRHPRHHWIWTPQHSKYISEWFSESANVFVIESRSGHLNGIFSRCFGCHLRTHIMMGVSHSTICILRSFHTYIMGTLIDLCCNIDLSLRLVRRLYRTASTSAFFTEFPFVSNLGILSDYFVVI